MNNDARFWLAVAGLIAIAVLFGLAGFVMEAA